MSNRKDFTAKGKGIQKASSRIIHNMAGKLWGPLWQTPAFTFLAGLTAGICTCGIIVIARGGKFLPVTPIGQLEQGMEGRLSGAPREDTIAKTDLRYVPVVGELPGPNAPPIR